MPFHEVSGIRYFSFDGLADCGVTQAVFTRQGGVSPDPWAALNLGGTVGDDPQRVAENRLRAFHAVGRSTASIYDVWQVHGKDVVVASAPRPLHTPHLKADAMLTDRSEVTLFMRFADCVPILLCDPVHRVVGLAHAGWKGTVRRVAAAAVEAMQAQYGSHLADIRAAIGPSIGAHHYPVGPDVTAEVRQAFGSDAASLLLARNGAHSGVQFDLWAANQLVLEQAGVQQVEVAGLCTACQLQDWYSHRAEAGKTGRFGALIALEG
jgi:YfiH family protein